MLIFGNFFACLTNNVETKLRFCYYWSKDFLDLIRLLLKKFNQRSSNLPLLMLRRFIRNAPITRHLDPIFRVEACNSVPFDSFNNLKSDRDVFSVSRLAFSEILFMFLRYLYLAFVTLHRQWFQFQVI